jgi:hypothetical protein
MRYADRLDGILDSGSTVEAIRECVPASRRRQEIVQLLVEAEFTFTSEHTLQSSRTFAALNRERSHASRLLLPAKSEAL